MRKKVNVLQVQIGGPTFSGISSYLFQQYKYIDRSQIRYDFLFFRENSMELVSNDPVFTGSHFFTVNTRRKNSRSTNYRKITEGLNKILETNDYDAVVVNTSILSVIMACLKAVKRFPKVKFIAHAHNTELIVRKGAFRQRFGTIVKIIESLFRKRIRKEAYAMFACSTDAGAFTFGKKAIRMNNFMVVHNAIEIPEFQYNQQYRDEVREELCAGENTVVIGNVGKLSIRKNQAFLIQVFSIIHRDHPDTQLWLIGEGTDKEELVHLAEQLHLDHSVLFLGQKTDVNRYLQGMDAYAFTTLTEGLGIAAIEAQAAGIPTIISDGVPDEVLITPLAKKIALSEGVEKWAQEIQLMIENYNRHYDFTAALIQAGYDLESEGKRMTAYYLSLL